MRAVSGLSAATPVRDDHELFYIYGQVSVSSNTKMHSPGRTEEHHYGFASVAIINLSYVHGLQVTYSS